MKSYIMYVTLLMSLITSINAVQAQVIKAPKVMSAAIIEGNWVAEDGDMTYEITFVSERVYSEPRKDYMYKIYGKITYRRNGEIIRDTELNGNKSFLRSSMYDEKRLTTIRLRDNERKIWGEAFFEIDEHDPKTARWTLRYDPVGKHYGYMGTEFDIPKELIFHKIE